MKVPKSKIRLALQALYVNKKPARDIALAKVVVRINLDSTVNMTVYCLADRIPAEDRYLHGYAVDVTVLYQLLIDRKMSSEKFVLSVQQAFSRI